MSKILYVLYDDPTNKHRNQYATGSCASEKDAHNDLSPLIHQDRQVAPLLADIDGRLPDITPTSPARGTNSNGLDVYFFDLDLASNDTDMQPPLPRMTKATQPVDKERSFGCSVSGRNSFDLIDLEELVTLTNSTMAVSPSGEASVEIIIAIVHNFLPLDHPSRVTLHHLGRLPQQIYPDDNFHSTLFEIMERREHELRNAKERLEIAVSRVATLFEITTDNVIIVGPDWRISYMNQQARMEIANGGDFIGGSLFEVFPDIREAEIFGRLREARLRGGRTSFELFCSFRQAWYNFKVCFTDRGMTVCFRDITAHKDAVDARRLVEEQRRQSQKMAAVNQLTGSIAHDFNNLLMVISGNLELIYESAGDIDKVRKFAETAMRETDRGAKLTKQLLALSRHQ